MDIQLFTLVRPNDIPATVAEIETVLYAMFNNHVEQLLYQREYKIANSDMVTGFNGDALHSAMAIRMKEPDEMFAACGLNIELYIHMDEGRIKPSLQHLEQIARFLDFPIAFFTSDIDANREHKNTFICYAQDYGDE